MIQQQAGGQAAALFRSLLLNCVQNRTDGSPQGEQSSYIIRTGEEATMFKNPITNFEIPTEIRNHAEQSVKQAKTAFDDFMTTAQKTAAAFEGQAAGVKASAKEIGEKAMAFAEKNISASFEFAQKVVRAKDIQELTQLQTEFVKAQMATFVEQAKALGQTVAKDAVRPAA